jgi:hypothetical protein
MLAPTVGRTQASGCTWVGLPQLRTYPPHVCWPQSTRATPRTPAAAASAAQNHHHVPASPSAQPTCPCVSVQTSALDDARLAARGACVVVDACAAGAIQRGMSCTHVSPRSSHARQCGSSLNPKRPSPRWVCAELQHALGVDSHNRVAPQCSVPPLPTCEGQVVCEERCTCTRHLQQRVSPGGARALRAYTHA